MGGKVLSYEDVKRLEKLPTKKELIATIARLIKQVSRAAGRWTVGRADCCNGAGREGEERG